MLKEIYAPSASSQIAATQRYLNETSMDVTQDSLYLLSIFEEKKPDFKRQGDTISDRQLVLPYDAAPPDEYDVGTTKLGPF